MMARGLDFVQNTPVVSSHPFHPPDHIQPASQCFLTGKRGGMLSNAAPIMRRNNLVSKRTQPAGGIVVALHRHPQIELFPYGSLMRIAAAYRGFCPVPASGRYTVKSVPCRTRTGYQQIHCDP